MAPRKTPSKKLIGRKLSVEEIMTVKKTDANDVSSELDDFRGEVEARLYLIESQLNAINEKLEELERNDE
jgi:hypothetical protein